MTVAGEEEEQEDRYQEKPQHGQQVREVDHPDAWNRRRSVRLARHSKQRIGSPTSRDAGDRVHR
jgi:hypothetical protein